MFSFFRYRRLDSPEQLIQAVITDMQHQLTEARIQMLAADLARQSISSESAVTVSTAEQEAALKALSDLEGTLHELEAKRNLLVARARDADARLAIERALMETGRKPAEVALEMLAQRVMDSESQADATAEVNRISGGGANGG